MVGEEHICCRVFVIMVAADRLLLLVAQRFAYVDDIIMGEEVGETSSEELLLLLSCGLVLAVAVVGLQ